MTMTHEVNVGGLHNASKDIIQSANKMRSSARKMEKAARVLQGDWTGAAAKTNIPKLTKMIEGMKELVNLVGGVGVTGGKIAVDYNKHEEELGGAVESLQNVTFDKEKETVDVTPNTTANIRISDVSMKAMEELEAARREFDEAAKEFQSAKSKSGDAWLAGGTAHDEYEKVGKKVQSTNDTMDAALADLKKNMTTALETYKTK